MNAIPSKQQYSEQKIRLKTGSDMHYFLHRTKDTTPSLLHKLTRCSLVKAYYAVVLPEHWTCKCYYCKIEQAILSELCSRGEIMLLRSCVDLKAEDKHLPFFSIDSSLKN